MDFIRGQNTPYFSWDFDLKMISGPLRGSFEKRAPGLPTLIHVPGLHFFSLERTYVLLTKDTILVRQNKIIMVGH